jgi:Protein of unknown function (DUF2852)
MWTFGPAHFFPFFGPAHFFPFFPFLFFAPMMLLFMVICVAGMLFMMRMHRCRVGAGSARTCGGLDLSNSSGNAFRSESPAAGHSAFERRLDQEQREFQEFIRRLRMARGKVEFDQFMTEQGAASKD